MKNILVPTDFSDCATYAADLGIAFSEFFDATLHLLACIDIPLNWEELSAEEKEKMPEATQRFKNANVLLEEWRKKAKSRGVDLQIHIEGGGLLGNIVREVAENQVDFVVIGSHGASGKQEYFIGSNTQKVIRRLHVPIFVIKQPIEEYSFKNVIFASNFDAKDKEPFQHFLKFIEWFTPETIHLLAVNTGGWFNQPTLLMKEAMKDFKELCGDQPCKTHFYRDLSVDVGVRHFAEEIHADLIVISNHHRRPLKRIFSGSNVEALVNHCDIPVLSIDYFEKSEESSKEKLTF